MSNQEKAYANIAYTRAVVSECDYYMRECDTIGKKLAELREDDHTEQVLDMVQPKAEPVQEPVAWGNLDPEFKEHDRRLFTKPNEAAYYNEHCYDLTPLYTAPQDGLRKAAQMALTVLEIYGSRCKDVSDVQEALREALK